MIINHKRCYKRLRRESYSDIGNQLDAIYKAIKALSEQGIELPQETIEWINHCGSVKNSFPKDA